VRAAAAVLAVVLGSSAAAKTPGLCASAGRKRTAPAVAVLSAFPAELAPLVAAAEVETTVEADGRRYDIGRLEGVRVVLGLTGIGTVNAADRATAVIRSFAPTAIVMSAVAGSRYRIGDVVIPAQWLEERDGSTFAVNPAMLALARRAATALPAPLQTCTRVPPASPDGNTVCLPYEPAVVFAVQGQSGDPFNGQAFACVPGGGEIFGCELPLAPAAGVAAEAEDMETAAVAHAAAAEDVPFVAMRAVSDGAGDPLGDRQFPAQFLDYYRLAAENAALVTRAFLAELHRLPGKHSGRRVCRLLARRRWDRAAARLAGS
jgi:nucleoside phosphorylase